AWRPGSSAFTSKLDSRIHVSSHFRAGLNRVGSGAACAGFPCRLSCSSSATAGGSQEGRTTLGAPAAALVPPLAQVGRARERADKSRAGEALAWRNVTSLPVFTQDGPAIQLAGVLLRARRLQSWPDPNGEAGRRTA